MSVKFGQLFYHALFLIIISNQLIAQDTFEEFMKAQAEGVEELEEEFRNYVAEVTAEYDTYEEEQARAFEEFKDEVEKKWAEFRFSSNKTYVDYDADLDSRVTIDFENGEIIVEVILEEEPQSEQNDTQNDKIVTPEIDKTKSGKAKPEPPSEVGITAEKDIEKNTGSKKKPSLNKDKAAKQKLQEKLIKTINKNAGDGKPILKDQLTTSTGKNVSTKNAESFSKEIIKKKPTEKNTYVSKDGKKRTIYTIKLPLKSGHLNARAERFKSDVLEQAKRFDIDPTIAFAVIETESAFNPKARSHIPAYGLMQLVPKSGARDAYLYVYKEDKFLDGQYLYQPKDNIELGCAYLAKLRHVYFKRIKDDEKAYICAIPAYNTGIGNVAKALTGKGKLGPASEKANSMSPEDLYDKLYKDLKYDEARHYLERVWSRKAKYEKWL